MFPLFDCNQELVAWISPGKNIFDTDIGLHIFITVIFGQVVLAIG